MFRVKWLQAALAELATLMRGGESRPGGRRITFVAPLAVRFQIEADGQTVTVLQVRLFGRRTQ